MPLSILSPLRKFWSSNRLWDKALTIAFLTLVLVALGALVYILISPRTAEKYTEFYLLGQEGRAENYPRELLLGQEVAVIVGIANLEYKPVSYRLEVAIDEVNAKELGPIGLNHAEKWEQIVSLRPSKMGAGQKVEFRLYRSGVSDVYRSVYLWIDVKASGLKP